MTNKKVIIASLSIVIAILAIAVVTPTKSSEMSYGVTTPNAKDPTPTLEPTVPVLKLSDDTGNVNSVTCQQPPAGNVYGGIAGAENNPPVGTTINPEFTKQYSKTTATGECGTYWYIAGWWFSATEMAKLPQESIMYGVSPYAITSGSNNGRVGAGSGTDEDNSGDNGDNSGDGPIIPVPEVSTIILVTLGISIFIVLKKINR